MTLAARLTALHREAVAATFSPPLGRGDAESYNNAVAWLGDAAEAAEAGDLGLALHRMAKANAAFDGLEPDGFGDALLELELAAYGAAAREEGLEFEPPAACDCGQIGFIAHDPECAVVRERRRRRLVAKDDATRDLLQLQDEEEERWRKASDRKGYVESPSPSPPPSIGGSSR